MARQTLELLGARREFDGYVEIGTTGRYVSVLRKQLQARAAPLVLVNDVAPTNSPVDIVERGRLAQARHATCRSTTTRRSRAEHVPDASVDLVTCYIGLHHITPEGWRRSRARSRACCGRAASSSCATTT